MQLPGNVLSGEQIVGEKYFKNLHHELVPPSTVELNFGDRAEVFTLAGIPPLEPGLNVKTIMRDYRRNSLGVITPNKSPILEPRQIYCIKLNNAVKLPHDISGQCDTKSAFGRSDVLTYVIGDRFTGYGQIPKGYEGDLYLIIVSNSFALVPTSNTRFTQARLWRGERKFLDKGTLGLIHLNTPLVPTSKQPEFSEQGIVLRLDLSSENPGFISKGGDKPIHLDRLGQADPRRYFEKIQKDSQGRVFLEKGKFILAKTQQVRIPEYLCGEVTTYLSQHGDLRVHYAGFAHSNFGYNPTNLDSGSVVVLEIRNMGEVSIILSDQQIIGALRIEAMEKLPPPPKEGTTQFQEQLDVKLPKWYMEWQ